MEIQLKVLKLTQSKDRVAMLNVFLEKDWSQQTTFQKKHGTSTETGTCEKIPVWFQ